MDRYAQLDGNGIVHLVIESEYDPDGINGEWILCPNNVGPGWKYTNPHFFPPEPPATPVDEAEWYIDIGPFNDRFGSKKLQILASSNPVVKAFNDDKNSRHWIDLKREDVQAAVGYMAGIPLPDIGSIDTPILTMAEVQAIINTPVAPNEQRVLRKLYFK